MKKKLVSFLFDISTVQWLREESSKYNISMSQIISKSIRLKKNYLNENKEISS